MPTDESIPVSHTGSPLVRRPNLLFLNRSFWPDTEATGQLLTELAVDLNQWFDVTVIAGRPNHIDEAASENDVKVGDYRGVTIHRAWHSKFSKHSSLGRLANLMTFTLSAWSTAGRLRQPPDIIVVQTDPFFLPWIGTRLRHRYRNCPLVCYLQDLYPDIAVAVGKIQEGVVTRAIRRLLFSVYRECQKVIVLSSDMRRRCEDYGVPKKAIEVVANWADTEDVYPIKSNNAFRRQHGLENRFVVMYSGNMGLAHDLNTFLDAAVLLRECTNIEWVFVGDGARRQALALRVKEMELSNVRFIPYQPRAFLAHSLSAADVHLLSVVTGATACVMPSKLYGILASGTPTVAVVEPDSELSKLINEHQVGFTCIPGDAESLADRIREMADNSEATAELGRNARRLAETEFSRTPQTSRIAEILCQVLDCPVPESIVERRQIPRTHDTLPSDVVRTDGGSEVYSTVFGRDD